MLEKVIEKKIDVLTNSVVDTSQETLDGGVGGSGGEFSGVRHRGRERQGRRHRLHRLEDQTQPGVINERITYKTD